MRFFGVEFGVPDDRVLPADNPARVASDFVRERDPARGRHLRRATTLEKRHRVAPLSSRTSLRSSSESAAPGKNSRRSSTDPASYGTKKPMASLTTGVQVGLTLLFLFNFMTP